MKKTFGFATSALTLALLASPAIAQQYGAPPQQQQGYSQQQQQGYQQGQRWDVPPPEFNNDVSRRAFHDGMDAAHNDWQSRRPLDARRSYMFRRPPTDRMNRDQYRSSFARGYQVAVEHRDRWMDHNHDRWNDRDHDHDHDPR